MPAPKYEIEDVLWADQLSEFLDFLGETHGHPHPFHDTALLEWAFLRSDQKTYSLSTLRLAGEIEGILGYMPTEFFIDGQRLNGVWTSLWYVRSRSRKGLGSMLMRRLMERFQVVAGQGASEDNQRVITALGHEFVPYVPKYVAVLKPFWFEEHRLRDTANWAANGKRPSNREPLNTSFEPATFNPDWSLYFELRNGTVRSSDYLSWKYFHHPYFEYQILRVGNPGSETLVIGRTVQISDSVLGFRVLELFGPSGPDFLAQNSLLVDQLIEFASDLNCDFVEIHTSSRMFGSIFGRKGFARDDLGLLPSLVSPVSRRRTAQNLEFWLDPTHRTNINWAEDFFVTRGDGDQERPGVAEMALANSKGI